jgi:beta-N-acetylhexosaminidase
MFKKRIGELTLEKKLYQLIISRLDGFNIHSNSYKERISELVEKGIGGFIVFGGKRGDIKDFLKKIQSLSEIPLFISSDVECGMGKQIGDTTFFPCQMAIAAAIDKGKPENVLLLKSAIRAIARESIDVGINMPLIPVLDVNQNPDNPIICTRAFSDNPDDVSWFASVYERELEGAGLISCAKHFPGHGDTNVDSHISLPIISKSLEDLMKIDLVPFIEAIKEGVSSIMVGHLSIPNIDSKPASLSRRIITDLLRKEFGFDGLVLTDALNMNALKGFDNISIECIKAGVDILLHPLDVNQTAKELLSAIESKEIMEEQIDEAVNRILKTKGKIKNIRRELKRGEVNYQSHKVLSSQITDMSITLLKSKKELLPVSDEDRVHVVFAGENDFFESSPFKTLYKSVSTVPSPISLPQGERVRGRVDDIFSEKLVIFAIFTSVSAGKGSSGIDDKERKRISELIQRSKNSVVISFGCPYVLRYFKDADMLIAAYEATEQAQMAVIKCLKGEIDFKGRLPVKIKFLNGNGLSF